MIRVRNSSWIKLAVGVAALTAVPLCLWLGPSDESSSSMDRTLARNLRSDPKLSSEQFEPWRQVDPVSLSAAESDVRTARTESAEEGEAEQLDGSKPAGERPALKPTVAGIPSDRFGSAFVGGSSSPRRAFRPRHLGVELRDLDEEYDIAASKLFEGGSPGLAQYGSNPFERAIEEQSAEVEDTSPASDKSASSEAPPAEPVPNSTAEDMPPETSPSPETADAPPDQGPETPPDVPDAPPDDAPPETPAEPSADDPPPDQPPPDPDPDAPISNEPPLQTESPEPAYDFLVLGESQDPSDPRLVFRAIRDESGDFLVEDGSVLQIPAFAVRESVSVSGNVQVVTSDWNGDGLPDVVLARNRDDGLWLELFLRKPAGLTLYENVAQGHFPLARVRNLALFDFDADGVLEIAAIMAGNSHLVVYSLVGGEVRYLKELVLPFEPSLVMDLRISHTGRVARLLYVFDQTLTSGLTFSSFAPDVFQLTNESPALRILDVFMAGDSIDDQILAVESHDRVIVVRRTLNGVELLTRFDTSRGTPDGVIGDYFGNGGRQMLLWP